MAEGEFSHRRRSHSNLVAALLRGAELPGRVETPSRSDGGVTTVREFEAASAAEVEEIVRVGLVGFARVELVLAITWG